MTRPIANNKFKTIKTIWLSYDASEQTCLSYIHTYVSYKTTETHSPITLS